MNSAKQNAINLYLEGIEQGRVRDAVNAYTGERYTQHSTGVADGKDGFIAFFEPFVERCPVREFKLVRALQEGQYVFLQVYQNINNGEAEWLTTDFFDTNADAKIIEHWDVISAYEAKTASGRSPIDGPTEIVDLDKTAANKELVTSFIETCLVGRQLSEIDQFISRDRFMQHSPNLADGLGAFLDMFGASDCPLVYEECFLAIAEGNFVATLNRARLSGAEICLVDLFRVENGLIVEHWDNFEPVPPKSEWANSGKF